FFLYGRKQNKKEYALLHVMARLTNRVLRSSGLESELREIIHERDAVDLDWFDALILESPVIDWTCESGREAFFQRVSHDFSPVLALGEDAIAHLLEEREAESSTALSDFVAIPHIVIEGEGVFRLLVARCLEGLQFSPEAPRVKAVFMLVGTKDTRMHHLRALAAIAQTVSEPQFEEAWLAARTDAQLKDLLLLSTRRRHT
ncbi:PTS sugar transporter subunit IIA, partial [Myxococcota bacterium]|nr:PTS sugar transporter subunit IIA [Myxococcota bacterium]